MAKFTFDRSFYAMKDAMVWEFPGVVFYGKVLAGKAYLQAFLGKQAKYAYYYNFKTVEQALKQMQATVQSVASSLEFKAKYKAERVSQGAGLEVGDVVVSSWGYDQTNVNAYQVVARAGKNQVTLRAVDLKSFVGEGYSPMSDHVQPVKDDFVEKAKPFKAMARNGSVKVDYGQSASKWDGQRKYYRSWYA